MNDLNKKRQEGKSTLPLSVFIGFKKANQKSIFFFESAIFKCANSKIR